MPITPTLPQRESDKIWREAQLDRMRHDYAFTLTYGGVIATLNNLPSCEKPGLYYYFVATLNVLKLLPSLPGFIWKAIKYGLFKVPFEDICDYKFFGLNRIPAELLTEDFWSDKRFARQFVAGANPVIIQGVRKENPIPSKFNTKIANLPISDDEFDKAHKEDRLYFVNFEMMDQLKQNLGEVDGNQKYICSPFCLFIQEETGHLAPLGIQLDISKDTSDENPIIVPEDGDKWKLAKVCLQNADSVLHELWIHATQIHYLMESIIMASYRQLGMRHPLLRLLDPHLQYTLSVNVTPLYEPDKNGKVPYYGKMFPPDNDALVKFMAEGMKNFKFRARALPKDLEARFVNNEKLTYPYRDDGKKVWDAIQDFASEYVGHYYKDDQDVVEDYELQAWANEIGGSRADGKCGINDFPTKFKDTNSVAEVVGQIIYTATAYHSAIHIPQYPYAHFVPNMPNALYHSPMPLDGKDCTNEGIMRLLPPFKIALLQTFIYYAVNFKVNRIGEYNLKLFDKDAREIIKAYRKNLKEISLAHQKKYRGEVLKYPYMDPAQIPNSVTS